MSTEKSVGIIGLGRIGSGLMKNLCAAGYTVYGLDKDENRRSAAREAGVVLVDSPLKMAAQTDRVVLSLMNVTIVETVLFGAGGLLAESPGKRMCVVDTTTMSPEKSRLVASRCAQQGCGYLDAPVTGGEHGAQKGLLWYMVGGEKEDFSRCEDLFEVTGDHTVLVGESGAGSGAKMVNQLLMCAHIAGAAESITYLEEQNVSIEKTLDAINPDFKNDRWLAHMVDHRKKINDGDNDAPKAPADHYTPLFLKDMGCVRERGGPLPVAEAAYCMIQSALENGCDGPFPWSLKTGLDALRRTK